MKKFGIILACSVGLMTLIRVWPLAWTPLKRAVINLKVTPDESNPDLRGTLWRGEIIGLEPVGTLRYRLSPFNTLKGKPLLSFSSKSRAISSQGTGHLSGVKDVTARGDLAWILPKDRRFGGIQGHFDLIFDALDFDMKRFEKGCVSAKGSFETDVLQRNHSIWYWTGPKLSGPIRCEAGHLVTALKGFKNGQDINVLVKMQPDGIYSADIQIITNRQGADAVMSLYGFTKSGRTYSLIETGKWR